MRKLIAAVATATALIAVPSAHAVIRVADPTPTKTFTDGQGNAGYVEVDEAGAIRVCNENEAATPAGDQLSGYAWVSVPGESTTPTYGGANLGAGDADGEGVDDGNDENGTEGDDCP